MSRSWWQQYNFSRRSFVLQQKQLIDDLVAPHGPTPDWFQWLPNNNYFTTHNQPERNIPKSYKSERPLILVVPLRDTLNLPLGSTGR